MNFCCDPLCTEQDRNASTYPAVFPLPRRAVKACFYVDFLKEKQCVVCVASKVKNDVHIPASGFFELLRFTLITAILELALAPPCRVMERSVMHDAIAYDRVCSEVLCWVGGRGGSPGGLGGTRARW